ncbi:MAG: FtsX-like permease family protein [Thermoanaerobaculia bacterium]|nr:FtsX-like permease family protein [Thermoanaerobaculia bacterium]
MTRILRRTFLRHLLRHPWQTGLTGLGVALAVSIVVGIDLANASAERAFDLAIEAVAGRTTHEVIGGPDGLNESLYTELRSSGEPWARRSAPVVEGRISIGDARRSLRLLGLDPFAEPALRDLGADVFSVDDGALGDLLVEPRTVALAASLADELGVDVGDSLEVTTANGTAVVRLVSRIRPRDELARRAARDLLVADVATAQELLGQVGRLDRIDLRLVDGEADAIRSWLSERSGSVEGIEIRPVAARSGALDQMTRAFRLNLEALSLLALLVGVFLVHNTLTFSVVRRRPLLGRLRALGVQRRELLSLVLLEGAVLGGIATAVGLVLGLVLAEGLLGLVVRTINDLYFAVEVQNVSIDLRALAKGGLLGVGGSLLAALAPAREATTSPPRWALLRSQFEQRTLRSAPRLAAAGLLLCLLASALLAWPSRSLPIAFAAIFVFVLGFAGLVPAATVAASHLATPLMGRGAGLVGQKILGRMAARGVAGSLSRTGVAMAALTLAVATTLGVQVMILSFRATLVDWLETTLQADVYVAAQLRSGGPAQTLGAHWTRVVSDLPGVESVVSQYRTQALVQRADGTLDPIPARLAATRVDRRGFDIFRILEGDERGLYEQFASGHGVLVSEPFAYHRDLGVGDTIRLMADDGVGDFPILAVYSDYATDRGIVTFHRDHFEQHFRVAGERNHSLGLFLASDRNIDDFVDDLERRLEEVHSDRPNHEPLPRVVANAELKRLSLEIFDRTFAITGVLRLLAIGVAFLGVLSALMALQLERARELGVLRATGLTPGQVWGLVTLQTGVMGSIAGLLSLPLGAALAALLVHVINKRSFGWTLAYQLPPMALVQALGLALVAALLAGLYPAWKMSRSSPALALREE